jgi:hypothetical protein
MSKTETPGERKQRLLKNLEKARAASKKKREEIKAAQERGEIVPAPPKKRPRNLDKIVRDILDDDSLVDKVIQNQPEYWNKLPSKNGGYIIATVMMVKAMGGDIKAAEWIRKTGFGDKVLLEDNGGFFSRNEFTIQVVPSKQLDDGINSQEVLESEIKQIEEHDDSRSDD